MIGSLLVGSVEVSEECGLFHPFGWSMAVGGRGSFSGWLGMVSVWAVSSGGACACEVYDGVGGLGLGGGV